MLKHVVLWKLKESAEGNTKQTNAQNMKQRLLDLANKIEQIISIEVGINASEEDRTYDVILITRFDSKNDLDIYVHHPAHQEFVQYVRNIRDERVVVDFEED